MAGLSVRVQLDDRTLRRLLDTLGGETRALVRKHGLAVEARARTTAPRRDGLLANSHTTRMQGNDAASTALVAATAAYAAAVHNGRRAVDIYPRTKKALFWAGAGHPVRHVHQKARAGKPWLAEALAAEEAPFRADLKRLIERS